MARAGLRGTDAAVQIGVLVQELIAGLDVGARIFLRVLANPLVDGDREALQRAFLDLLDNALAHNRPRGVVRVTVGEIGTGVFVELLEDDAYQPSPAPTVLASERENQSLMLNFAREVVEAHGGGLRCIDCIDRLLLVYLPLARAA
jgi:hypothetical protein